SGLDRSELISHAADARGCRSQSGDRVRFAQATCDGEPDVGTKASLLFKPVRGEGDVATFAAQQRGIAGRVIPCSQLFKRHGKPVIILRQLWYFGKIDRYNKGRAGVARELRTTPFLP